MITIAEAYSIWKILDNRYQALISTKTYLDQVKDAEFKKIIIDGIEVLETQIKKLEKLTKEFSINMPNRPPEDSNASINYETITDRFIYRSIIENIYNAMFQHLANYQRANSSNLKTIFRNFLNEEIDLYDGFHEYGKVKSYIQEAPAFRI